jgi:flagellar protein FlaF
MLTLCKFVDEHTVDTLKSPEPEKIRTLIEINRNIAAGLLESLKTLESDTDTASESTEESEAAVTNISTSV